MRDEDQRSDAHERDVSEVLHRVVGQLWIECRQINVMFDIIGPLMSQVRFKNAKAIAVTAKDLIPAAAEVLTMAEQGVSDFVAGTWAGIIAPAGTPQEIVDRISAEAKRHW